jgi:hypothetical protein
VECSKQTRTQVSFFFSWNLYSFSTLRTPSFSSALNRKVSIIVCIVAAEASGNIWFGRFRFHTSPIPNLVLTNFTGSRKRATVDYGVTSYILVGSQEAAIFVIPIVRISTPTSYREQTRRRLNFWYKMILQFNFTTTTTTNNNNNNTNWGTR